VILKVEPPDTNDKLISRSKVRQCVSLNVEHLCLRRNLMFGHWPQCLAEFDRLKYSQRSGVGEDRFRKFLVLM